MSNDWLCFRFGWRFLHIGPWYVRTGYNQYFKDNPEPRWFQVYW